MGKQRIPGGQGITGPMILTLIVAVDAGGGPESSFSGTLTLLRIPLHRAMKPPVFKQQSQQGWMSMQSGVAMGGPESKPATSLLRIGGVMRVWKAASDG
jgi:hypothetical protein